MTSVVEDIEGWIVNQLAAYRLAMAMGEDALAHGILGQVEDMCEELHRVVEADQIRWTPWEAR